MKNSRSVSSRLFNFLGSMNLAITLLVILAIASVIGTILQQNQPYADYKIKFGNFWFEFFRALDLYDVYSAPWFLFILAFLIISTTTCVIRNTPGFLREIRQYREKAQEKSLLAMKNQVSFLSNYNSSDVQTITQQALKAHNYRFRVHNGEGQTTVAAMKGGSNRLGYWLTHIGIIVICLGGLLDSRLPLMLAESMGKIKPETRNVPASQVPPESQLGANSFSYRGSVDIPEGRRANIIFLTVRDGYFVQRLPFEIEVKDFRVEHYSTGQPKSFESDLLIYDPALKEPIAKTISVNHPFIYKGTAIYQANFGDGGSEIQMHLNPFNAKYAEQDVKGNIFESYTLKTSEVEYRVELMDFRLFNINPITNAEGKEEQKNLGPSLIFRLRNQAGDAIEYTNYMYPVPLEGRLYMLSGVRTSTGEPQKFLHIPADSKGTAELFLTFLRRLQDTEAVRKAATETTAQSLDQTQLSEEGLQQQIVDSMIRLTQTFATQGFDGIVQDIEKRFPPEQVEQVNTAFMKVLQAALRAVYSDLLKEQGKPELAETDWLFFEDSLAAIANLPFYGSPWYVQMTGFKQVEASGLQLTRSPGKNVVYFGSAMLILGVFLLFYVAQRRLWVLIKPTNDDKTEILLAGSSNRNQRDFEIYFNQLENTFQQALSARGE